MSPNTHTESIKTLQLPNDQLIPELLKMIRDGHTVTLPLRGNSMRPFLEDGRDKALLKGSGFVDIGDPVLAEVAPGRYVLHRIVGNTGPHYEIIVLRGDGNLRTESCHVDNIKARVAGFYRKGSNKLDSTSGLKWRIYSWWWMRLLPLRRYLLFILYPHIPARFKKKTR